MVDRLYWDCLCFTHRLFSTVPKIILMKVFVLNNLMQLLKAFDVLRELSFVFIHNFKVFT